jgi:hypothetical protein
LYEAIGDIHRVKPLFHDLPEGVCPLVFPVFVSEQDRFLAALAKGGVLPFRWWRGYHPHFAWDEFPDARRLKDNVIAFRIDQHLTEDDIGILANRIRRACSG